MPSLTFAGGKLMLVYYDLRETARRCLRPVRRRRPCHRRGVTGRQRKRQTIDIRAAMGTPGAAPAFAPSVRVSDYLVGYRDSDSRGGLGPEQLQVNPPNLPMFKLGTAPFIGDYIDVTAAPAFVPTAGGGWAYNTAPGTDVPLFHAVWTDNRDVRPPARRPRRRRQPVERLHAADDFHGRWPQQLRSDAAGAGVHAPATPARATRTSTPRVSAAACSSARRATAKPLSPTLQRGFVVFATEPDDARRRPSGMRVLAQPRGRPRLVRAVPPAALHHGLAGAGDHPRRARPGALHGVAHAVCHLVGSGCADVGQRDGSHRRRRHRGHRRPHRPGDPQSRHREPGHRKPGHRESGHREPRHRERRGLQPRHRESRYREPGYREPRHREPGHRESGHRESGHRERRGSQSGHRERRVANPDIENPDIENPDIENPDIENPDIENGVDQRRHAGRCRTPATRPRRST